MRNTRRRQERQKCASLKIAYELLREPWHSRLHGRHFIRREEWADVAVLLRDYVKGDSPYLSYEQAQQWAKIRGFTVSKHWMQDRSRPFFAPPDPKYTYRDCWRGWNAFFDRPTHLKLVGRNRENYLSYGDAKALAISFGVVNLKTWLDVRQKHNADRRNWYRLLPRNPHNFYQEWPGWGEFVDRDVNSVMGKLYNERPRWFLVILGGDAPIPSRRYQVRYADVCRLGLTPEASGMLVKGKVSSKPWYPDIALGSIEEGSLEFVNR